LLTSRGKLVLLLEGEVTIGFVKGFVVERGSEELGLELQEADETPASEGSAEADRGGIGATLLRIVTFLKRVSD
jgi:hypothetical protein